MGCIETVPHGNIICLSGGEKNERVNFNCNSSIILQQLHLKSTTEIDNYIVTHCYYIILDNTVVKLLLKFLFSKICFCKTLVFLGCF